MSRGYNPGNGSNVAEQSPERAVIETIFWWSVDHGRNGAASYRDICQSSGLPEREVRSTLAELVSNRHVRRHLEKFSVEPPAKESDFYRFLEKAEYVQGIAYWFLNGSRQSVSRDEIEMEASSGRMEIGSEELTNILQYLVRKKRIVSTSSGRLSMPHCDRNNEPQFTTRS